MFSQTVFTIPALIPTSSSRVCPGLRGTPAVTTTTSESCMSEESSVEVKLALKPAKAPP